MQGRGVSPARNRPDRIGYDIRPRLEVTKAEISKYNALTEALDERKDAKGNDTFVLCYLWSCNSRELQHFSFMLCAVLTHSPNSFPPERLFNMINATFDDDQVKSVGWMSSACLLLYLADVINRTHIKNFGV